MFVQLKKPFLNRQAGERLDVNPDDAQYLIQQGLAEELKDDPIGPMIARAMESGVAKLTDGLNQAVELSLKQIVEQAKTRGVRLPFQGAGDSREDDPRCGFRNFGEFALAVKSASGPAIRYDERLELIKKAATGMGEAFGSDGGFLVPPEFTTKLLERIYDQEGLLGMTDGYTTAGSSLTFPRNVESSRVHGSRWGGLRAYWREEGDQATASKPTFGKMQLNLHKLFVLCYTTEELLNDTQGNSLEQYLYKVGADEINFMIGEAIINGTGAGQPLGILNSSCLVTISKETSQPAATLVFENVTKMWSRLFAPCRQKAVWLINQDVEPQFHKMAVRIQNAAGTDYVGGSAAYLPAGGLSGKQYATLFGRPVMPVEFCATLGTAGDIILADLSHYITLTKGRIDTASSMHLRFDYDEMAFRFIFRIDGQPWWASALTPFKGSNTQSCFVTLETRS